MRPQTSDNTHPLAPHPHPRLRRLWFRSAVGYAPACGPVPVLVVFVVLLLAVAISWGEFTARIVWPAATQEPWKRTASWVAAHLALEGRGNLIYAERAVFAQESRRLGAIPDIFEANAPTTFLPYLPLASLPVNTARTIWVLFSVACFVVAWVLLLWALRLPLLAGLALTALVPWFQPLRNNIYLGQAYTPILLMVVAGSIMACRASGEAGVRPAQAQAQAGRANLLGSVAAGLCYALVAVVRQFYGLAQLFPLLVRRQWAVLVAAVGLYGLAAVSTLIWAGPDAWATSLHFSLSWRSRPETAVTTYQSLNGFLTHLLRYDATWNTEPVADAPWLVGPLWWVLAAGMLVLSALTVRQYRFVPYHGEGAGAGRLLPYAFATPLALLLSPISEDYHFTQTLFPLAVLGAMLWHMQVNHRQTGMEEGPGPGRKRGQTQQGLRASASRRTARVFGLLPVLWALLVVVAILMGAPWRFYNVPATGGWNALLYYPRFYATLLLWAMMLFVAVCVTIKGKERETTPATDRSPATGAGSL